MAKRKRTKAERHASAELSVRTLANAERLRQLAERAQAKLDAEQRSATD